MKLSEENYFSDKAMREYMSVSQLKSFIGTPFMDGCEARAIAELNGEYVREKSDALLIGSYVDVMLTGTGKDVEKFENEHPEMYSSRGATKGQLLAKFNNAVEMVKRVRRDEFMMKTLSGEHQKIMVGEIYGVPFKIKIDSLLKNAIVDLKTCESISKCYFADGIGRISFIQYNDYVLQGAIYQEIVRQNIGRTLPFFLTCVTKEKTPDIAVVQVSNELLKEKLDSLAEIIPQVQMVKQGKVEPIGCGKCDYCKSKKVITSAIWSDDLMNGE